MFHVGELVSFPWSSRFGVLTLSLYMENNWLLLFVSKLGNYQFFHSQGNTNWRNSEITYVGHYPWGTPLEPYLPQKIDNMNSFYQKWLQVAHITHLVAIIFYDSGEETLIAFSLDLHMLHTESLPHSARVQRLFLTFPTQDTTRLKEKKLHYLDNFMNMSMPFSGQESFEHDPFKYILFFMYSRKPLLMKHKSKIPIFQTAYSLFQCIKKVFCTP